MSGRQPLGRSLVDIGRTLVMPRLGPQK